MYVQADLECAQQMGGTITGEPLTWIKAPQSATSPTGSFHLTAGEHTIRFVGYDRGLNFYKFFLTNDLTCSMSSYADKTCDYPGKAAVFGLTQITPTVTILPTMPLSTITPPSKTSPLEKQSSVTPLPTSTNSSKSRLQFQIAPTVVKTP